MVSKARIKTYMLKVVDSYVDPETLEVNATQLAEDAADHLGHPEWLDDDSHDVWDAAVEVAWSREGLRFDSVQAIFEHLTDVPEDKNETA